MWPGFKNALTTIESNVTNTSSTITDLMLEVVSPKNLAVATGVACAGFVTYHNVKAFAADFMLVNFSAHDIVYANSSVSAVAIKTKTAEPAEPPKFVYSDATLEKQTATDEMLMLTDMEYLVKDGDGQKL